MKYKVPDIYYLENWGKSICHRDNGNFVLYSDTYKDTTFIYPMVLRPIINKMDNKTYFDSITPFGFSGPYISDTSNKDVINILFDRFSKWELENNIVTEYIRYSPWLKDNLITDDYEIVDNNFTWFIDLTKDFWMTDFNCKSRNIARRAEKNNVKIIIENSIDSIDIFLDLYRQMGVKNNINKYYQFTKEEIVNQFNLLKDNMIFAYAYYDNICISSSIFLILDDKIHYHLSGNNIEYGNLGANHYLLYSVCNWAKERNIKTLHLGGADKNNIGLAHFKDSISKRLEFKVGKRIVNKQVYNELSNSYDTIDSYFPPYRQ